MPISLERRNAFMQAFSLYPQILMAFASKNCHLEPKEKVKKTVLPIPHDQLAPLHVAVIAQVCMAQLCVRLIRTRCHKATKPLQFFGFQTAGRYIKYRDAKFPVHEIMADRKYREAIEASENAMSEVIFQTLTAEVQFWEADQERHKSVAEGNNCEYRVQDFDELSFWRDVFLALQSLQKPSHAQWGEPIGAVILNHMDEFSAALDAQDEEAAVEAIAHAHDEPAGVQ